MSGRYEQAAIHDRDTQLDSIVIGVLIGAAALPWRSFSSCLWLKEAQRQVGWTPAPPCPLPSVPKRKRSEADRLTLLCG